jgi:two-component system, chemotaxis family, protein-glutamate methylesterase/glutaminase
MTEEFPVVALVCSAGGLVALSTVLAPLPADLPAAVLALQHLDPEHASHLALLLGQRTAMPVAPALDGGRLVPGRVYVAPPGHHTLIIPGPSTALVASGAAPPYRPSADLLLTTAAVVLGRRLIAVVLSGRGNDAATGATVVHRFGGTVIATTTATSTEPAMPEATVARDGIAGHVVALDEVAPLLIDLVTAPLINTTEPGDTTAG